MNETAKVRIEVWPVAADEIGLWLVSGLDAWRSGNVPYDTGPREEVQLILDQQNVGDSLRVIHSTSWRAEDGHVVLTYIAALNAPGLARQNWADATPISPELASSVGRPVPTPATGEPTPRHIDVLLHGLRHFRFLTLTDGPARDALGELWRQHLEAFAPALSGMYEYPDEPLTIDPKILDH
ncbi:hypothetical protein Pta02_37350 [Planobispora takensis]|uniref:Uncharacterized protein n=1 Tax=Planobispora takensis TaxID=1367882 RepID=A0A8J3SWE3_9ACTN|nr:hypothetical protein Pta02_37350 [Planobispora takensis]